MSQQSQDFNSIMSGLPAVATGPLQKAKCQEFVKKLTHNGAKAEQQKIIGAFNCWLKLIPDKLTDDSKNLFKNAISRMLDMMQHDGKITADGFLKDLETKLSDQNSANTLRSSWLSCWSDMFTACDSDKDDRLALGEAQTLLLAFNVPNEFSEPLFELLCNEFEETLDRRTYLNHMNDYFFTEDRESVFGKLFSDSVSPSG